MSELAAAGATPVAVLVTEPSENDFPGLPVREGEKVVVWIERYDDAAAYEARAAALDRSRDWRELMVAVADHLAGRPYTLRLAPCARSVLA